MLGLNLQTCLCVKIYHITPGLRRTSTSLPSLASWISMQFTCFHPETPAPEIPDVCSPILKAVDKTITSVMTLGSGTRLSLRELPRSTTLRTTTSWGALDHAKLSHWQPATPESFNFNNHAVSKKLGLSIRFLAMLFKCIRVTSRESCSCSRYM